MFELMLKTECAKWNIYKDENEYPQTLTKQIEIFVQNWQRLIEIAW